MVAGARGSEVNIVCGVCVYVYHVCVLCVGVCVVCRCVCVCVCVGGGARVSTMLTIQF